MKKIMITSIAILASLFSYSQKIISSTYVEQTSVSPKMGFSLGFENKYGFECGGFYQDSDLAAKALQQDQTQSLPRFYEKDFLGVYGSAPIIETEQFDLKVSVRTGVINKEFFSITPSVLGYLYAGNKLKLGTGLGIRAFRPTYQGSLSIIL